MIHGIISILIPLLVFVLYIEIRKVFIKRKLRHFEYPAQIPILGVAGRFLGKPNDQLIDIVFDAFREVQTTPIQVWLGPVLMVGVSEPRDIQILLTSDECLNKPYFYEFFHFKTSIIATHKEQWKPSHRALNTTFNIKMLQSFIPILNEKLRILLTQMDAHVNEPGDTYRTIFICMIDMVVRTTMGSEMKLQSERGASLYKIAKQIMNNIQYRVSRVWLHSNLTYQVSKAGRDERIPLQNGNKLFDEIYEKKMDYLQSLRSKGINHLEEANENSTTNFLEKCLFMEQEGIFSHENVLDQMRVIVLAGIDTSSITVFGTLLMLAINQKHQDLVVDELRTVFESADCDVTQTHLTAMKYTERVIKESMRLIPPVPFIGRKPSADIELPKGTVPKDTMVLINIMHLHRNPNVWGENVLEFDPDRFLPENVAKRPPFSYVAFSGGPRNCIGMKYAMMSAKTTLAHLLRRFKFSTDLRFDEIRLNTHLVTEVVNEKPLRITARDF